MKTIFISGDGVAACCCAYLLKQPGFRVAVKRRERPRLPAILLSDAALALIQGVFGELSFNQPHPIRRRVVAWGPVPRFLRLSTRRASLFLIPNAPGTALVLAVGDSADLGNRPDFRYQLSGLSLQPTAG